MIFNKTKQIFYDFTTKAIFLLILKSESLVQQPYYDTTNCKMRTISLQRRIEKLTSRDLFDFAK